MRVEPTWRIVAGIVVFVTGIGVYGMRMIHNGVSVRDEPSLMAKGQDF
jgi:hypothetical protein